MQIELTVARETSLGGYQIVEWTVLSLALVSVVNFNRTIFVGLFTWTLTVACSGTAAAEMTATAESASKIEVNCMLAFSAVKRI